MDRGFVRVAMAFLLLAVFLVSHASAAEVLIPGGQTVHAGQCRELVYAANPNYPPYHWKVSETAYDGASKELLELVVPPGVTLKPTVLPWKRALEWARLGKVDLLLSLRITPERSEYLKFTTHRAFPNPIVVFVRADRTFPLKSWADLKGKKGGISLGDTFGNGFDEYLRRELTIEEAPTMENNFVKLEAGRIDYFVTSQYVGKSYAALNIQRGEFISLTPAISDMDIHFGFSRASPCAALAEQVSRRLKELDRQGVPEQLLDKYLSRIKRSRSLAK
ncbi:MAG TPA: ABC transporter substrate-binding protein [Humidesulfovibrio sp.]|uniref:substrate-binding periplasmic protein n=1 Tax=Humidesulfovibrio sp. TaxID=2910988 RepID=UPI002CDDA310|nr:ABC transporter substrate-binding protein [Humidesulfovibrio sp.]HWR03235.1 ABC transporter substrate-binding protein [Humidesulfovibrio sp.]